VETEYGGLERSDVELTFEDENLYNMFQDRWSDVRKLFGFTLDFAYNLVID